MTTVVRWHEQTRSRLRELLPEALVVLPIGATEQHGPHLPTGTDALLAETVVQRAVERATDVARPLVVAPTLPVGASDHHLPFGGTLSVTPETLHAVLVDLARSIVSCGGRRLVIVNGHGGNHGVAHAAGAAASNRYDIAVATTDYWRLAPADGLPGDPELTVPGHAGAFETSLVLATRPELVVQPAPRTGTSAPPAVDGFDLHASASWSSIDGYTDDPATARADEGAARLDVLAAALADRLAELSRTL